MLDTSLDSSNFYFLVGVFQGILLACLIRLFRAKNRPNLYFTLLVFLFSISQLHRILESSIHIFNAKFPIPMEFGLAYGPLAYLHILHIKDPIRKFQRRDLLHFLPTLIFDALLFIFAFLYIGVHIEWAYENIPLIQSFALYMSALSTIQFSIYTYFIFLESRDTRPVLKEFAQVRSWLSVLVISWICLIGFAMIAIPIGLLFIEQLDDNSLWIYLPMGILYSLWICIIGYLYLMKYAENIQHYMDRVGKFSFSRKELDKKKTQLLAALAGQALYKDPTITVAKLAGHMGWPINSVSTLINETLHTNFNDLINHHRILAFQQLIREAENQRYSIIGLGHEVGFSSKTSFYRAFKKETGMTPSDYIKSQV